jgi:hypothetical protein
MERLRLGGFLALATMLAGCGSPSLERFTPPEVDKRSREYLALFAAGQVDSASAKLVAPLRTADAAAELRKIAEVLRNTRFDSVWVIGANTNTVNGVRHVNLTYEFRSGSGLFLANVASVDSAGTWFVEGVSARTIAEPLELAVQFTLKGKSALHYLWLLMIALCAATSIGSATFIASRRQMPKRWRWVLLSLVGIVAFHLNWTTGAFNIGLLQVQLAAAGFARAGTAAPWILSFAIPAGAFIALRKYSKWRKSGS